MLDDVAAVEIDVFHQRPTILAVKNDVFTFPRRASAFNDNAQRIGWPHRSMRDIRRDKERLSLAHKMIDDPVSFADAYLDVALQLIKIFLRIDEMEIVSRVRALDHHDKKIPTIVEITITYRGLEEVTVFVDPLIQIDRRSDSRALHRW